MRTKIGILAAVVGLTLALGVSASQAATAFTIIDTDNDTTIGSISFPTLIGREGAGGGGVLFSAFGFTQADITSVGWSLESLDPNAPLAVNALNLNALMGDNPCPNGGNCTQFNLQMSPTFESEGEKVCFPSGICRFGGGQSADIAFALVPVPEPSTWAMLIVGFVGLGIAGRRSLTAAVRL
jgi:hypothetical protein